MNQSNKLFDSRLIDILESFFINPKGATKPLAEDDPEDECPCDDVVENGICGHCGEIVERDAQDEAEVNYER